MISLFIYVLKKVGYLGLKYGYGITTYYAVGSCGWQVGARVARV